MIWMPGTFSTEMPNYSGILHGDAKSLGKFAWVTNSLFGGGYQKHQGGSKIPREFDSAGAKFSGVLDPLWHRTAYICGWLKSFDETIKFESVFVACEAI